MLWDRPPAAYFCNGSTTVLVATSGTRQLTLQFQTESLHRRERTVGANPSAMEAIVKGGVFELSVEYAHSVTRCLRHDSNQGLGAKAGLMRVVACATSPPADGAEVHILGTKADTDQPGCKSLQHYQALLHTCDSPEGLSPAGTLRQTDNAGTAGTGESPSAAELDFLRW